MASATAKTSSRALPGPLNGVQNAAFMPECSTMVASRALDGHAEPGCHGIWYTTLAPSTDTATHDSQQALNQYDNCITSDQNFSLRWRFFSNFKLKRRKGVETNSWDLFWHYSRPRIVCKHRGSLHPFFPRIVYIHVHAHSVYSLSFCMGILPFRSCQVPIL